MVRPETMTIEDHATALVNYGEIRSDTNPIVFKFLSLTAPVVLSALENISAFIARDERAGFLSDYRNMRDSLLIGEDFINRRRESHISAGAYALELAQLQEASRG